MFKIHRVQERKSYTDIPGLRDLRINLVFVPVGLFLR